MPASNASKSGRDRLVELARQEQLSILALARRVCGYQGLEMVGTAAMVADQMQLWLDNGAADGFNVMFSHLPGGATAFVEQVVPELQRRKLLRQHYSGTTLREHLGLKTPQPGYSRHRAR